MSALRDIGLLRNYVGRHFFIRCQQDSDFVIDSRFFQNCGGGQIILFKKNYSNNANQVWTVDTEGHIMNVQNPNMILYAQRTANSTPVILIDKRSNPQADSSLAKWRMNSEGEIVSMADGVFMLNVQGGKMKNRAGIIMYHRQGEGHKNDKWKLDFLLSQVVKPRGIGLFENYVGKPFFIKCQQNSGFVLDTAGNQRNGGGEIILWKYQDSNVNQIWTVDSEGHIMNYRNPNSILCAGNTNDSFRVEIIDKVGNPRAETDLARWSLNSAGEIVSMANENVMLNVQGAKMENTVGIIMYHRQGAWKKNDKWIIQPEISSLIRKEEEAQAKLRQVTEERDRARRERDEALAQKCAVVPGSYSFSARDLSPDMQSLVLFDRSAKIIKPRTPEVHINVNYNVYFVYN